MDITIGFRNPIRFVNQWCHTDKQIRACFIWCVFAWSRNDCDVWIKRGVRFLGIEIEHTQWLSRTWKGR
jgi:hypothetical protein